MKKKILIFSLTCVLFLPQGLAAQQYGQSVTAADTEVQPGKISLDMKGMDIVDVLKILALRGNLNIVAGKDVRGKVTLFLKNVEVMDALEIILVANGLAYEQKGNIINVMTDRDYELLYGEKSYDKKVVKIVRLDFAKAAEVSKTLTQIKSKIGKVVVDEGSNTMVLIDLPQKIKEMEEAVNKMDLPTKTRTFSLNYAKASVLEEKIKSILTSNVGELQVDERMNKIIVTDFPEKIDRIAGLITEFDERDSIVLIEAKIVEITLNKDISYGINWNNVFAGIDAIAACDLSVSLPSDFGAWPHTFTYTRAHGATEYGDQVILKLLERLGKTDVLSTPRITVANNEEAKVLVGTKQAYVTSTITQTDGTTTTADNVEFIDVGVRLSVTPTISRDGNITMKIKPEVSSAGAPLQLTNADGSVRTSVPIVTTSEAETQLMVRDGTTIIMAGLMKDTRTNNVEKIPGLGDIPLLGHFFRSKGKGNEKTELVIFLTPHIIREREDYSQQAQAYIHQHENAGINAGGSSYNYMMMQPEIENAELTSITTDIGTTPDVFPQYCNYLSDRIERNLQGNIPSWIESQEAELSFILARDGSLIGRPKILSPTDAEIKELITKSVEDSAPFFPFPEGYEKSEQAFILTVCFGN